MPRILSQTPQCTFSIPPTDTMLQKTFRSRFFLLVANLTKGTLLTGLLLFGLLPISTKGGRITTSPYVTCYSIVAGLSYTGSYLYILYRLSDDPALKAFYGTVSGVTVVLQCTCSVLIIGSFYTIALLYRFRFAAFYNRIIEKYSTYGSFYGASFAVGPLSPQDVDGEEELTSVYLRVFFKVVLVPCVASLCSLGVAVKNYEKRRTSILRYTGFLLMPSWCSP